MGFSLNKRDVILLSLPLALTCCSLPCHYSWFKWG